MRLTCPNCGAEYEVEAQAIPEAGRDVQCSNCGHAWFQPHPEVEAAEDAAASVFDNPPQADLGAPSLPSSAAAGLEDDDDEADDGGAPPPPPGRAPRTLDDSVLAVLREEADREVAVRRAEAMRTIETQPELGLEAAVAGAIKASAAAAAAAAAAPASVPTAPPPPADPAAAAPAPRGLSRRELLPDIEEINSTLRDAKDRSEDDDEGGAMQPAAPIRPARRSGFRSGFVLMMILAVGLSLAYLMAPRLAAQMPGAAPALQGYVTAVDGIRLWLDRQVQGVTRQVDTWVGTPGGDGAGQ